MANNEWNKIDAIPVDLGAWSSYESYSDPEQLALQRNNLIFTGLYTGLGEVRFIYSRDIARMNDYLDDVSKEVRIEDTEVRLEDEVFYTSKMEGAHTSRKRTQELHNGAPIDKDNAFSERMVKNGFSAVKKLNLYGGIISDDILIDVWSTLIDGCCMNEDIRGERFRTGDVIVGNFTGADVRDIPDLMKGFCDFYNGKKYDDVPFVKASILHYAFETIHPFCDGNGRMGRLLVNNYLISRGIESARAVSFSMEIDKNRPVYDAAFIKSENIYNDCTPFVSYYTETMASAYESVYQEQQQTLSIKNDKSSSEKYSSHTELRYNPEIKFIVLCGIPGSGKETRGREIANNIPNSVFIRANDIRKEYPDNDDIEIFSIAGKQIKAAFNNGKSVIYDAANLDVASRTQALSYANSIKNVSKELIVMYQNPDIADSDEPVDILRSKAIKLHNNVPSRSEGWDKIEFVGKDPYKDRGFIYSKTDSITDLVLDGPK